MNSTKHIDALAADNKNLYFLLGALTDAFEKLPELSRAHFLRSLRQKVPKADVEQRYMLDTLIEALETQPRGSSGSSTGSQPINAKTETE